MSKEEATRLAFELLKLGVSHAGVQELLVNYPYEVIDRQLSFMPYRKAKRPEAFIMEAVRRNYSPPKEFFYAKAETQSAATVDPVDEGAECGIRPAPSEPQGH